MMARWSKPFYVIFFLPEEWETWCLWEKATPEQRFVGRGEYDLGSPYPCLDFDVEEAAP
jgi:hypothetical protein